ncbi:MAG: hypothetical protein FWD23_16535, partial [Oscillospiraceae bacterium]|nr:hypothetical protein [Oscillospiraceae bacterium]
GLVPPEDSLTDTIKLRCTGDILDGCHQWYGYFNELCGDMYKNTDIYLPASARQYRDILENIAAGGRISGDLIIWDDNSWQKYGEKLDKSKVYATTGLTLEGCLKALGRTGLRLGAADGGTAFHNEKYPKIFHAMKAFECSPNIRKTPARHHFAHCEFRQLFKSYSANYDELLRRVSDESLAIAHSVHDYAKSLKIQRYVHFDTIKYKHKNTRVMDFAVSGNEYPTLRINIGASANPGADMANDEFCKRLSAADKKIQDTFSKNLKGSRIQINPFKEDLEAVIFFIGARKASIDQYF